MQMRQLIIGKSDIGLLKEHTNLYPETKNDIALDIHMQKIKMLLIMYIFCDTIFTEINLCKRQK